MANVTTATAELAYDDVGSGRPILLLHATLHDRTDWKGVVGRLSRRHRVLAMDWPGHGESPLPLDGRAPGAHVFAEVLEEFVVALDLRDLLVIGNSVGGYAACRLAATRPDRIAGVITVQGAGFTPTPRWVRAYCRLVARPGMSKKLFPLLARLYMRPVSDHDREIVSRVAEVAHSNAGSSTFSAMWSSFAEPEGDLTACAGQITTPVLVTWGKKDLSIPRFWAKRAHRAIAGSQFAYLSTGHLPFTSDPIGFLDIVEPFIATLEPTGNRSAN